MKDDRISELPQPILHDILDCLSQQEAVRTCLLSKSWRYLGSTRPIFDMREIEFKGSKQEFINVLERYLQLYLDHKICPERFVVCMSTLDAESISFLDKWTPILVRDLCVKTFSLFLDWHAKNTRFDPPSIIFESESLQYLTLQYSNLNRVDIPLSSSIHLKKLCLFDVIITEEILEKIICSCPLIALELKECVGPRAIRIDKRARHLKRFECSVSYYVNGSPSLESDVPSLEEINVGRCSNWYHDKKTYFPHLKSLIISSVRLSTESFGFFSHNFPCLETLSLKFCYGFEEFELSSCSIKKFELSSHDVSLKRVVIDVPSIVMFKYGGRAPESFSFTTTSEKWKSDITLRHDLLFDETSPRLGKVGQLLKAVSRSEISLDIRELMISSRLVSSLMDILFCICRPRIIQRSLVVGPESKCKIRKGRNKTTKLMCKILGMEKGEFESGRITRGHHWRQDLEKVIFETRQVENVIVATSDENRKKWRPVLERSWSEFWEALLPEDFKWVQHFMRFRLSWRE
ncbi:Unknown protein [Striga hermonthica]|uniref:F-box domain-containing protein n=1 Tax=Striga hermonthica TaxID=68872 RepID=A0A9N7RN06_STRHE|nr:Unknown protein [Striga hermonthica]